MVGKLVTNTAVCAAPERAGLSVVTAAVIEAVLVHSPRDRPMVDLTRRQGELQMIKDA
jgi:hypothetical protein